MPPKDKEHNHDKDRCSFCGKMRSQVEDMFDGPGGKVRICDQCVALCTIMMAEKQGGGIYPLDIVKTQESEAPKQAAPVYTSSSKKFSNSNVTDEVVEFDIDNRIDAILETPY